MKRNSIIAIVVALALLVLAIGGYQWWRTRRAPPPVVATAPEPPPAPEPEAPPPPPEPTVRNPIESMPELPNPDAAAPPAAAGGSIKAALQDLLGRRAVLSFLNLDDFIAHVVATVDNLDREHVAVHLWPVHPTPGRFSTVPADQGALIASDNAKRYQPFVRFIEAVDTPRAVALYIRLYPQFQQAYAGLGYPRRYFNDRLIEVIDKLIESPVPSGPVAVRLVEVKGPVASKQPWTRYEFADPALEALPAGQKIMMRMGPDNELRLKAKLAEFRRGIAKSAAPR